MHQSIWIPMGGAWGRIWGFWQTPKLTVRIPSPSLISLSESLFSFICKNVLHSFPCQNVLLHSFPCQNSLPTHFPVNPLPTHFPVNPLPTHFPVRIPSPLISLSECPNPHPKGHICTIYNASFTSENIFMQKQYACQNPCVGCESFVSIPWVDLQWRFTLVH